MPWQNRFASWPDYGREALSSFPAPETNGGDGVACARFLMQRGYQVRCFLCGSREKMTPDLQQMERRLVAARRDTGALL